MEVKSKTAIIGAGLAGLSAAIRLKKKGFEVHVFEKNERHGGKLDEFEVQGFRFDKGPSLLTEPWLIDELQSGNEIDLDYEEYIRELESQGLSDDEMENELEFYESTDATYVYCGKFCEGRMVSCMKSISRLRVDHCISKKCEVTIGLDASVKALP
jgi:heterodisulfide reductase subunit A-like polyferredoxin